MIRTVQCTALSALKCRPRASDKPKACTKKPQQRTRTAHSAQRTAFVTLKTKNAPQLCEAWKTPPPPPLQTTNRCRGEPQNYQTSLPTKIVFAESFCWVIGRRATIHTQRYTRRQEQGLLCNNFEGKICWYHTYSRANGENRVKPEATGRAG